MAPKRKNDEPERAPEAAKAPSAGGRLTGCLLAPILAPFRLVYKQLRFVLLVFALSFGACGGCALFAPAAFQSAINIVRSAGLRVYTVILSVSGNPALKVTTYEGMVSADSKVERDMGLLSAVYGEGAEVSGQVRVGLGADLMNTQFGVLSCEVLTDTLQVSVGRAPLASTAFDKNEIMQKALAELKKTAAGASLSKYWAEARQRLKTSFFSWGLGVDIPEKPTLTACPN